MHGLGVRKENRGLAPDIVASLPDTEHLMFDYNKIDEANNTLTVVPLDKQVEMLTDVFDRTRKNNPTATIDLICHSQGCIVAALAKLNARKTILLAPQIQKFSLRDYFEHRNGSMEDDIIAIPRSDGSTTLIGQDYMQSYDALTDDISSLFSNLSSVTNLTIIEAIGDEVLGKQDYSGIMKSGNVKIVEIHSDHNFKNEARQGVIDILRKVLK
jgi:hypothetical protein